MTAFDPIKAQREIITGLADVHKVIGTLSREAERKLAEAEAEHNQLALLDAYVRGELQQAHNKLRVLEAEAEGKQQLNMEELAHE